MTSVTGALLQLGRELRYRELPIIGKSVVIETLADVPHVLRQLAAPWLAREPVWEGTDIEAGLAKYGLIDRWCETLPSMLDGGVVGIAALRANGFSGEPDPDHEVQDFVDGCIIDLVETLGPPVLKLFLEDKLPVTDKFAHNKARYEARLRPVLLPEYFPRGFVITDACVTNARAIWLGKHFYL